MSRWKRAPMGGASALFEQRLPAPAVAGKTVLPELHSITMNSACRISPARSSGARMIPARLPKPEAVAAEPLPGPSRRGPPPPPHTSVPPPPGLERTLYKALSPPAAPPEHERAAPGGLRAHLVEVVLPAGAAIDDRHVAVVAASGACPVRHADRLALDRALAPARLVAVEGELGVAGPREVHRVRVVPVRVRVAHGHLVRVVGEPAHDRCGVGEHPRIGRQLAV